MAVILDIEGFHLQASGGTRGSDKSYLLALVDHGIEGYRVHAHWGRRGTSGDSTRWGPWASIGTARVQYDKRRWKRIREGYDTVNWRDPVYGMTGWLPQIGQLNAPTARLAQEGWVPVQDAAATYTISLARIRTLIRDGSVGMRRVGGVEFVFITDLDRLLVPKTPEPEVPFDTPSGERAAAVFGDGPLARDIDAAAKQEQTAPLRIHDHPFEFGYRDRVTDAAYCDVCNHPQEEHVIKTPPPPAPRLHLPGRRGRDITPMIRFKSRSDEHPS